MKKTLFLVFVLMLCITSVHAQKSKKISLDFLKNEKELNVIFDYSEAKFEKKLAEDYFAQENAKNKDWEAKYKEAMITKFIAAINGELSNGCRVRRESQNVKYQLIVKVIKIDDDCDTDAEILVTEINSINILAQFSVYGAAGSFGSFTNLCGDAIENIGEKTGKFIAKKIDLQKRDSEYYRYEY